MKYVIKVNTIPFDYWYSMTRYDVGDWFQFATPQWSSCFPYKVVDIEHAARVGDKIIYKYKLG